MTNAPVRARLACLALFPLVASLAACAASAGDNPPTAGSDVGGGAHHPAASGAPSPALGAPSSPADPGEGALPPGGGSGFYCPSGFAYDATHRMCLSATEAAGPFPAAMIASCKRQGGGSPCEGDRWAKDFAIALRGAGTCAPGASMDVKVGYCVDASSAYGPFTQALVATCKAHAGGAGCESMRWSLSFFGVTPGAGGGPTNPLDVPYYSQYHDAAESPGSSCGNTSAAMLLSFFGKKVRPDDVRDAFSGGGQCGGGYQPWQCADGLASIYEKEGLVGRAKNGATRADIKRMIDEGRPVIIHTNMTSAGHIVVIVGYDDAASAWIVNDPAGHWCGDGYDSCGGRGATAKAVRYSYASFGASVIGADGDVYVSAADTKPFTL